MAFDPDMAMQSLTSKSQGTACCGSSRNSEAELENQFERRARSIASAATDSHRKLWAELLEIPGGIFEMGTRRSTYPADLDSPRRKVKLEPFRIAATSVSNAQYAAFAAETGYRTVAETEGWSFVFHLLLDTPSRWPIHPPGLPWWRRVDGAYWAAPEGQGTSWEDRADHPATHITWYDALAYVTWAGLRLPYEAEWEKAARGGLERKKFPWGNRLVPNDGFAMNTWQGEFPHRNTAEDGFVGTAPITAFNPNSYGLYNMTGNVWEWVADYFGPRPAPSRLPENNPTGPNSGTARVQRGGSFLCHLSYCDRYHVHSRTQNDPDSSTSNSGFRVAADLTDATPEAWPVSKCKPT